MAKKLKLREMGKRGALKDWTDDELIDRASDLNHSINVVECFGSRDVLELQAICNLLESRGYEWDMARTLVITKPEDDES